MREKSCYNVNRLKLFYLEHHAVQKGKNIQTNKQK